MSIKRITVSVPRELASKVKKAAGKATVSAFVAAVLEERIENERLEREWQRYAADLRAAATGAERAEADAMFVRVTRSKRGGRRVA